MIISMDYVVKILIRELDLMHKKAMSNVFHFLVTPVDYLWKHE